MLSRITRWGLYLLTVWALTGCGTEDPTDIVGSDEDPDPPPEVVVDDSFAGAVKVSSAQSASAFLSRATFGPRMEEIDGLLKSGNYNQWLDAQFAKNPGYHMAWAKSRLKGIGGTGDLKDNPEDWRKYSDQLNDMQRDAWWDIVVNGQDQLRQRVAFALSEIMVVSRVGPLSSNPDTRMSYYDLLVKNAFGNFETLLQEVAYHPAMGKYLTYLGNEKADPEKENHPDENYAREVMQLFTIGLYELNLDGSQKLDSQGKPVPTYTQKDVEQMAKVFTGLSDQNDYFHAGHGKSSHKARTEPMIPYEEYHDTSEKIIMGHTLPAGRDTRTDINEALNLLFNHPNAGPFFSRQLIQRLVTSNPSPGYIKRVASAFNDNGKGVRGDMKAVIQAVLLDKEAREGATNNAETFGKAREPLLFVSHLFRAFHAQKGENTLSRGGKPLYKYSSYNFHGTGYTRQEGPLEAMTVFNHFTPEDAPYRLKKEGLVAPEFEVFGTEGVHQQLLGLINQDGFIYKAFKLTAELKLDAEIALVEAKKHDELLDHLDTLLVGGGMSLTTRNAIKGYIEQQQEADTPSEELARHAISLVMASPDYAIQR